MIAVDQLGSGIELMLCTVCKRVISEAQRKRPHHCGVSDAAQRQNNGTRVKFCQFLLQVVIALSGFHRRRFVLRGDAANGVGNPAVNQAQTVVC